MRIRLYIILFILGLIGGIVECKAILPPYTNHVNFKSFTLQDGLKDNTVFSIHKDAKGIMWLGTATGLSKYDGNHFTNYTLDQHFNMNVVKIEEDRRHILYMQTNDWITYMNCKNEATGRLKMKVKEHQYQVTDFSLPNDSTLLACDNQTLTLFRITLDADNCPSANLKKIFSPKMEKEERFMKFLYVPTGNMVYLATNHARILLMDLSTGRIVRQKRLLTINDEFGTSTILCQNGKLFISSMRYGIFIMDTSLENTYRIFNEQKMVPTHLSHNDVYNLTPISESSILAATWHGYTILRADATTPSGWTTEIGVSDPNRQSLKFDSRMIASYYDPQGFLWIGTHGGGVLVADWKWNFIKQYNIKEDNEVESMIIDNGRFYMATYEEGVFYSESLDNLKNFSLQKLSQTERKTTLCSIKDKNGGLWFGCKDGTLIGYAPSKKEAQTYTITDASINALLMDSKNNFWIGTDKGLYLYDYAKREKKEIELKQEVNCVLAMDEDSEGNLWIATSLGLLKLNYTNGKQQLWKITTQQHTYTAQAVLVAKDKTVYVGYQNGLGIIPPGETVVKHVFTTADGLESNWINCLAEDRQGYIWIGTNSGFSCYDKSTNCFYNYYTLGSSRSVVLWKDMLCWGGNKHLLFFSPQQAVNAFKANTKKRIIITGIEINNKPLTPGKVINGQMILKQTAEYADYISLDHTNKDFSLSFSNTPYSTSIKYEYRLMPYQEEWIECSSKEKISYANLPPGNYVFQIKNQKASEKDITSLKINIKPHWTQTITFRLLVLLCIIGGIYYSIFTLKRKHQRDRLIAELEHGIAIYRLQQQQEENGQNPNQKGSADDLEQDEKQPQQNNMFMQKVLTVIEDNIANENFNVKVLADTLCMSQPTLYRKVKEHFHLTVTELIRKMRMNKAASLLATHEYSILEISEMVGYNDYETFRKHFKNQFGVSASKYINKEI